VHDAGTLADGRVFYVVTFVEAHAFVNLLPAYLAAGAVVGFFPASCETVSWAHSREFFTGDLSHHMSLSGIREVLVMDWGLAKILQSEFPGFLCNLPFFRRQRLPETIAVGQRRRNHPDGMVMGTRDVCRRTSARQSLIARCPHGHFFAGKLLEADGKAGKKLNRVSNSRFFRAICEKLPGQLTVVTGVSQRLPRTFRLT